MRPLLGLLTLAALGSAPPRGPEPGERLPAFEASDQHGKRRSLADLRGPAGLVLVFFRSADW